MQRDRQRVVVDAPQLLEQHSAWLRVLTKTSVIRCALIARRSRRAHGAPNGPAQGTRSSESRMVMSGFARRR
jgi:hypothetical protein